ncbi:MAG: 3-dehydroquinate synthase [Deltaproteobacteria bacterium]|nr:3-dehydroquinate synthase [Deltaproteobacteria bacterium]
MSSHILQRVPLVLEYPVAFTRGLFDADNPTLVEILARREPDRRHRAVAVVDAGVAAAWPHLAGSIEAYAARHADRIELLAPPWTVPGGEAAKTAAVLDDLVGRLAALRVDRHAFAIAIGGGAALDVIGFAAATLHRGVRLVRVPTTVLAQNDAGVGVKNGINAHGAKNFLGAFAAPFAVIDDSSFLATLGARDRVAGMAEAVKVALVRDPEFFAWLEDSAGALAAFEIPAVERLVRRCAELHLAHIAGGGDPFEQGNARPLDYGHWAAHKLELLTQHELRHGEAVAIGMVLDARYAVEAGLLDEASYARIVALLARLGLPTRHDALRSPALLDGLADFREHLGGDLTITLLSAIGRGVDCRDVRDDLVHRAIAYLA